MLNWAFGRDQEGGGGDQAGTRNTSNGIGDPLLQLSSKKSSMNIPRQAQNPNYKNALSLNRRYGEEMDRLGVHPHRAWNGGGFRGEGGGSGDAARARREEKTMPGDGGAANDYGDACGHGRKRLFVASSSAKVPPPPRPPLDHLEIEQTGTHVSGLTGVASAREDMVASREARARSDWRQDGNADGGGRRMDDRMIRRGEGRFRRDHRDEINGFDDSKNGVTLGVGKRSLSPGHYRSRSRSRRSHSIRSRSSSCKQRKHRHRSSRHDRRNRRRGEHGFHASNSRSRSPPNHQRQRQRRENYGRERSTSRERARRSRREERRRRRRHQRRSNDSPPSNPNNHDHRHNHREYDREEHNDGGGNHSSPTYIVSEDSENYLAAIGVAVVDARGGDAVASENCTTRNNGTPLKKSNGDDAQDGSSAARSGGKKRSDRGARKRSRRDAEVDTRSGDGKKGRRRRDRRRSPSSEESSVGYSSESSRSPSRKSRSPHCHREGNDVRVDNAGNYFNNESSYNPAPPGLQLGHPFSMRVNVGGEALQHAPSLGRRSASLHDKFGHSQDGDNDLEKSNRKRKGKKRRQRHRSPSCNRDWRNSHSRSYTRGKRRRDVDDDARSFSYSASSASLSACGRKRQRHGSHRSRGNDAGRRSRSLRSYRSDGRNTKHPRKSKKRPKRTHHHHRSNNRRAAGAAGDGQSDSSRDDTVGHFRGGPGTMVGRRYRIIRDVGMGTFGRVVQCEDLQHASGAPTGGRSTSRYRDDRHHVGDNLERHNHDYNHRTVAIKIVRNVRRYHESALIEADICERVNREQSRRRKDLCARMLDRFALPSGHYCLVFECLGRSLYDFLKAHEYHPFPVFCVRDFARRLLEALDFLHGFGLIHTDLKPENVLLSNDNETTYRSWDGSSCRIPESTAVKVIDFGGATYDYERKSSIVNTRQYRAPEVILGWGWSYPSDLWSAGCIIAELYAGELLFATHDNAEHLALMERAVGPFPKELLDRSRLSTTKGSGSSLVRECFDSRGWHKIRGVLSSRSIEHVRKMVPVEQMVLQHDRPTGLGRLLRSLLTIDPKRRATAREALMSPFFTQFDC